MRKFGLDSKLDNKKSGIELEIMEEQATALGTAGRKLEIALEKYHSKLQANEQNQELLQEVADAAWHLILQDVASKHLS